MEEFGVFELHNGWSRKGLPRRGGSPYVVVIAGEKPIYRVNSSFAL